MSSDAFDALIAQIDDDKAPSSNNEFDNLLSEMEGDRKKKPGASSQGSSRSSSRINLQSSPSGGDALDSLLDEMEQDGESTSQNSEETSKRREHYNRETESLFARTRDALRNYAPSRSANSAILFMDLSFSAPAPLPQQMPVQQRKEERAKQRAQEKKEMEKKPTNEVLACLNNRQLVVQEKGVAELARRVLSPASPHHLRIKAEIKKLSGMRNLVNVLSTAKGRVLYQLLLVLAELSSTPDFVDDLRLVGGINELSRLVEAEPKYSLQLVFILYHLASSDKNRDALRIAAAIPKTVQLLSSKDIRVVMICTKALIRLAFSPKNQEEICESGGFKVALELTKAPQLVLQLDAFRLLEQLAGCANAKSMFSFEDVTTIIGVLRVDRVFKAPGKTEMTAHEFNLQIKALSIISSLCLVEGPRKAFGPDTVSILVRYCKPTGNTPFEVFGWNMRILPAVLKALHSLVMNDPNQKRFFLEEGADSVIKFVTFDVFPEAVKLEGANILSLLSAKEELRKVLGRSGIPSLIRLARGVPNNEAVQMIVLRAFKSLATDDNNKTTIFEEGGLQFLKNILASKSHEVVVNTLETFKILCSNKFMRRAVRLTEPMAALFNLLASSDDTLQRPCLDIFNLFANEDEGVDHIMSLPNSGGNVIAVMYSSTAEVQLGSVQLINVMILRDRHRAVLVENGLVNALLKTINSNSEQVQVETIKAFSSLATTEVKRNLLQQGVSDKLSDIKSHPNATKKGSTLIQPLTTLIVALKPNSSTALPSVAGPQSVASGRAPVQPLSQSQQEKIDSLIGKMNEGQVREICKRLIPFVGFEISTEVIRTVLNDQKSGRLQIKKKEEITEIAPKKIEKPEKTTEMFSFDVVMRDVVRGPVKALRHVDLDTEMRKRQLEKQRSGFNMLLSEIVQTGARKRTKVLLDQGVIRGKELWKKDKVRWDAEIRKFLVDPNLLNFLFKLLEIREDEVNVDAAIANWLPKDLKLSKEGLCVSVSNIGFWVKKNEILDEDKRYTEYESIIRPNYLPIQLILNSIYSAVASASASGGGVKLNYQNVSSPSTPNLASDKVAPQMLTEDKTDDDIFSEEEAYIDPIQRMLAEIEEDAKNILNDSAAKEEKFKIETQQQQLQSTIAQRARELNTQGGTGGGISKSNSSSSMPTNNSYSNSSSTYSNQKTSSPSSYSSPSSSTPSYSSPSYSNSSASRPNNVSSSSYSPSGSNSTSSYSSASSTARSTPSSSTPTKTTPTSYSSPSYSTPSSYNSSTPKTSTTTSYSSPSSSSYTPSNSSTSSYTPPKTSPSTASSSTTSFKPTTVSSTASRPSTNQPTNSSSSTSMIGGARNKVATTPTATSTSTTVKTSTPSYSSPSYSSSSTATRQPAASSSAAAQSKKDDPLLDLLNKLKQEEDQKKKKY